MKKLKPILRSKWFYIIILIITLSYAVFYFAYPRYSKLNEEDTTFNGIISKIELEGELLKLELSGVEKIIGNYYFKSEKEKNDFINHYQLGDLVYLIGTFSMPSNNTVPNLFNYKEYLKRKEIYYIMQIEEIIKIEENKKLFYKIKNIILNHITHYQSEEYLNTFILGDTSLLKDEAITSYQENGISHLFAISGMHISLLSGILLFILKKFHLSELKCYFIVICFLFFYMILSGNSPSIGRSVILFSLLAMNRTFEFKIPTIYLLILTFCILVFNNPFVLLEVGFQYSFIISFFLILLQKKINQSSYIKGLVQISIISFLVSFPISIYYFYQVNFLSIILNLIFVPLVSFIVFPFALLTFLFPFLDIIFLFITNCMEQLSFFFQQISVLVTIWMKPNIWWILCYYFSLFLALYFRKKIGLFFLLILLCYQYFQLILFPRNLFMVIDVGQGDSILIHSINQTMLIDTGGKVTYEKEAWQERNTSSLTEDTLIPLFKSLGIRRLDYLVLSHGDYDHLGEAINLIHNFCVKNVIFNEGLLNEQEEKIIKLLDSKEISYTIDQKNNQYQVGKFQLLSLNSSHQTENDSSIVFYMEFDNYRFLLMGDASTQIEEEIIQCYHLDDIDFLKMGHHGSKTSSSNEFLRKINPRMAFISVGTNNRYSHPSQEVLNRLEDYRIPYYLTSIHGTIQLKFKKSVTFSINPP